MVSKEISEKIPNRVPETRVVGPSRFRKPIEFPEAQSLIGSPSPYSSSLITGEEGDSNTPPEPEKKDEDITEVIDVPSLSDIENVEIIRYFDEVSNAEKARVFITIRNSSVNKEKVKGVDGRISL